MDWQSAFNIAATIAGVLGGWILRALWSAVENMRTEIASLERMNTERYVRRDDFQRHAERVEDKLDQIFAALQDKADKR